ncbi:Protein white [Chionoecetes opilio]|uniref:Protein white n=1 Tax=Chionoecetes opilio TaxID=41210 RepID=A0A8J4YKH9_CHIOP|nr:Protein white [Chionoecetes opilio]
MSGAYDNVGFSEENGEVAISLDSASTKTKQEEGITYSWDKVNVFASSTQGCGRKKVTQEKHILKDVTGICRPGELLAIMGASGAGKTTLLNVLTFRSDNALKVTGRLYINGRKVTSDLLTQSSAYVQQEDLFIGTFTVREQLMFQANLRMEQGLTHEQRVTRVEEVMQELSLTKCAKTLIGVPGRIKGISGGETKRLAFACELLTNPPLMFLDEPTSGLDSFMSPSAALGYTCPSTFNPADFFISTLAVDPEREKECREFVHSTCDNFASSGEGQAVQYAVSDNMQGGNGYVGYQNGKSLVPYRGGRQQFKAVLKRRCWPTPCEPMVLRLNPMISLGLLADLPQPGDDQDGSRHPRAVLVLTQLSFSNTMALNTFCVELPIFLREHFNGMYRTDVYFLSKNLAELPLTLFLPLLFVSICYYMIGLHSPAKNFFTCAGLLMLTANAAVSFGYMISCLAKNLNMALAIAAPMLIPLMLFGGLFLSVDSIPVYFIWIRYISWFNYGNEALIINQWRDVKNITCANPGANLCLGTGLEVINGMAFDVNNLGFDIGLLVTLIIGFRTVGFLLLLLKTRRKTIKQIDLD